MGELYEKIQADMKAAMKSKAEVDLATLRMLKSDLQYEMTKDGSDDIADDAVEKIIQRGIKKRREAMEQFEKGGRAEMAAKEQAELEVLERYLPPAVPEEEIAKAIDEVLAKTGASSPADMGKVMGPVMGKFKGQNIDGSVVKNLVMAKLKG